MAKMLRIIKQVGIVKFIKAGLFEIWRKVWRQIVCNSYSQNWEDIIIQEAIGKTDRGFYVEIGGYDPKRLSNTYRFYKKGFRGVVIEPNPDVEKRFKKYRPKDVFVNVGVGDKKMNIPYYKFFIPALNTFSKKEAELSRKKGYVLDKTSKVSVVPISDILKKYVKSKKIDILSIDTEGWNKKIIKSWDWKYRPKIICIENDKENEIEKIIKKEGYKLIKKTKYNLIFLKD